MIVCVFFSFIFSTSLWSGDRGCFFFFVLVEENRDSKIQNYIA